MRPDAHTHGCEPVEGLARKLQTRRTRIRAARADELATLVEIERAASELFRSLSMDFVADDDPGSLVELKPYAENGRAFVASTPTTGQSPISSSTSSTEPPTSSVSVFTPTTPGMASAERSSSTRRPGDGPPPLGAHPDDVRGRAMERSLLRTPRLPLLGD